MCPLTGNPVYIGKSKDLEGRKKSHLANHAAKFNIPLWEWISGWLNKGITPQFYNIAICLNKEEAVFIERFYIKSYGKRHNLFNSINNKNND